MSLLNGSPTWMYNAGGNFYPYLLNQSLRFNDNDSAYLRHTPPSAGNLRAWTWSAWVKRGNIGINSFIFGCGSSSSNFAFIGFSSDNTIDVRNYQGGSYTYSFKTTQLFRDVSAWYHLVLAADMDNSTAADRIKLYVNGERVTSFNSAPSPSTSDLLTNSAIQHVIGSGYYNDGSGVNSYLDGYLAEVNFVDGTAYDPTSFGETKQGVWIPKDPSVTYGDNGYRLEFKQTGTGGASSTTIGADTSGKNNHFTDSGLAAYDVGPDSPTNNFATLNPLAEDGVNIKTGAVLSEGNLVTASAGFGSGSPWGGGQSTIAIPTNKKIYCEMLCSNTTGSSWFGAVSIPELSTNSTGSSNTGQIAAYNRSAMINGVETDYGSSAGLGGLGVALLASGDILQIAVDGATGKVWFGRNGTYFKSPSTNNSGTTGDPAAGTHEIGTVTNTDGKPLFIVVGGSSATVHVNFGQDSSFAGQKTSGSAVAQDANSVGDFYYTPPADYLSLCSQNLPAPAIDPDDGENPTDHYNTVLYTGESDDDVTATNTFAADWVWLKCRNNSDHPYVQDTVRGFGGSKSLSPSSTNLEGYHGGAPAGMNIVTTDTSIQFLGDDFTKDSRPFVAWTWKAGGAPTATNAAAAGAVPTSGSVMIDGVASTSALAGSIAATKISANTKAGLSIGTFTKGSGVETVAHGLNTAPNWYVVKRYTGGTGSWFVYHSEIASDAETDYMRFNSPNAKSDDATVWGDTAPTNEVFSVAAAFNSGEQLVFYAGHDVEGFSKFGIFSGNSSGDGTFVNLGFRPARIWLKRSDSSSVDWTSYDLLREGYNDQNDTMRFAAATEQSDEDLDILSNGFKMRRNMANNQGTIAFFAWAHQPFKYANAR